MKSLHLLLIAFIVGWLPVQGIAAVTMPFCARDHAPVAPSAGGHCDHEQGAGAQACDDCGLCQLAQSAMLPGGVADTATHAHDALYTRLSKTASTVFLAQPQRPPRA